MHKHNQDIVIDNTLEPRKLLANNGVQWIRSAWMQFKAFPFVWMTLTLLYIGIAFISLQHILLSFLSVLVMPILNGGLFVAAATGDQGVTPRIEQLLSACKKDALKLMIVGAVWGFCSALFQQLLTAIALHGIADPANITTEQLLAHFYHLPNTTYMILAGLFGIFIYFSIAYAVIPGLVIFNRLTPLTAYRFAISACLRNWQPILLYILINFMFGVLASMPVFFGWIIFLPLGWMMLLPIIMIANFYIWKDLFTLPMPVPHGG